MLFFAPYNSNKTDTFGLLEGPKPANLINSQDLYISISGNITFKNTFGYLNAELYPLLNFYIVSTILYLVLGIVWGILLKKYSEFLIAMHHFLTLLLVLGFVESAFMYFEYFIFN